MKTFLDPWDTTEIVFRAKAPRCQVCGAPNEFVKAITRYETYKVGPTGRVGNATGGCGDDVEWTLDCTNPECGEWLEV